MTNQVQLYPDNSVLANFKAWGSAISAFFTTAGWTKSSDTGQVNWSTIASVPAGGSYVYEIWTPNDGLTNFYLKVEYGSYSTQAIPTMRLTLSSSTNGSGTCTGNIVGPYICSTQPNTSSTTVQYECDMSGAAGRIGFMMWRNSANVQQLFAVERSLNSSGTYTSTYVTLVVCGNCSQGSGNGCNYAQGTVYFGVGAIAQPDNAANYQGGWAVRMWQSASSTTNSGSFNGTIPFDTVAPNIGYFDYPMTMVGIACYGDISEGATFTVTLYGSTRTYMGGKTSAFAYSPYNNNATNGAVCMRYD